MIERRGFIGLMPAVLLANYERAFSQQTLPKPIRRIRTNALEIAYEDSGPERGIPVQEAPKVVAAAVLELL